MEFDPKRVFTAANANELKVGSLVYLASTMAELKEKIKNEDKDSYILEYIMSENYSDRFSAKGNSGYRCPLAYLIKEPEENKLKWTDLKIGDIIRKVHEDGYRYAMVVRIDTYSTERHIGLEGEWITDESLEEWEKMENKEGKEINYVKHDESCRRS